MDDTIYRQAAIDAIIIKLDSIDHVPQWVFDELTGVIGDLPSAQSERKKGKWIWKTGDVYKCSECETETHVDECFEEPIYNYCPYCNAVMDGYER